MSPPLAIVRRDLTRLLRSPLRTLGLFAVPLAMAAMFTLAFGGGGGGNPDVTIRILVEDRDDSLFGQLLQGAGDMGPLELVFVDDEGLEMMARGEATALLVVPEGFTDDYLAGRETTLELIKNPAQRFLPGAADEGVAILAVVLSEISQAFRAELAQLDALLRPEGVPDAVVVGALAQDVTGKLGALERYVLPPTIELETVSLEAPDDAAADVGILDMVFPGLAFFGILFLAQAATRDILHERESGLLRHLLTAPVSIADYLAGKCLSVLTITVAGFVVMVVVGFVVGVRWGPPLATLALVATAALAASGLLLLIASLARTETQQDAVATIVIMGSSLVGGSMVPLGSLPAFLLPISRMTLNYWAADGFNELVLRGGGLADLGPNLLVLGLAGAVFLTAGAFFLRRRLVRGVV